MSSPLLDNEYVTQDVSLEEYYAVSRDEEIATQLLARHCWSICVSRKKQVGVNK